MSTAPSPSSLEYRAQVVWSAVSQLRDCLRQGRHFRARLLLQQLEKLPDDRLLAPVVNSAIAEAKEKLGA